MNNHRAKQYHRKFTRTSDGYTTTELCEFTEVQVASIGAILHSDGIDLISAVKLCKQWTRSGQHVDVQYSYSVPFVKSNS